MVDSGDGPSPSPWLSVWYRPAATIERVTARKGGLSLPLLAALGSAAFMVVFQVANGLAAALIDWRFVVLLAAVAAVAGTVSLYVYGLAFCVIGRLIGGRASPSDARAVFAWGMAPAVVYLAACFTTLVVLTLHLLDADQPPYPIVLDGLRVLGLVTFIWAFIATIVMMRRVQSFGWARAALTIVAGYLLVSAVLGMPIRAFLFQPFNIPAASMVPTLVVGDAFVVSKFAYGYSRYSLPAMLPAFSGRVFGSEPQRGDVAVFRLPGNQPVDYVKRIVGLPGERVQMVRGEIVINGAAIKRERVEDFIDPETGESFKRWRETLPNGVSYFALDTQDNGPLDDTQAFEVPLGHYFMLGDNLDNSIDSRATGAVPLENLIGRADLIYFSVEPAAKGRQPRIRWERAGMRIR